MSKKKLSMLIAAGIAMPVLALAAQPLLVNFDGRTVPMHEQVSTVQTAAGPMQVRTWRWSGPGGNAMIRVSESSGAGTAAMPHWALAQMRAMQAQMQQMQAVQTQLTRALLAPGLGTPMPTLFAQPFAPALSSPLQVRFLEPMLPLQVLPAGRVIIILPASALPPITAPAHPVAPAKPRGELT